MPTAEGRRSEKLNGTSGVLARRASRLLIPHSDCAGQLRADHLGEWQESSVMGERRSLGGREAGPLSQQTTPLERMLRVRQLGDGFLLSASSTSWRGPICSSDTGPVPADAHWGLQRNRAAGRFGKTMEELAHAYWQHSIHTRIDNWFEGVRCTEVLTASAIIVT